MDDKDRVFARFKDDKLEAASRRELLTIPRRAGGTGSRVVEVVHVRSGETIKDRPRRVDTHVRGASWEGGFPAKQGVAAFELIKPITVEAMTPAAHVMPAWEPAAAEEAPSPPPAQTLQDEGRPDRGRPRKRMSATPPRRVADPFDANDDGANCVRCGLITCAECG